LTDDDKIARFLALAEDTSPNDVATTSSSTTTPTPTPYATSPSTIPGDSQLPTAMSCRQAFDLATSCQSIAGQLRNVYRYGETRSCSEHWADFWFCMRAKGTDDGPVKEAMIREHYRDKERRKYHEPGRLSSEQVWAPRMHKVPADTFFNEPINPPVADHDEWRRLELERRRKIREACEKDERQR
jgi:hypothetical protein